MAKATVLTETNIKWISQSDRHGSYWWCLHCTCFLHIQQHNCNV